MKRFHVYDIAATSLYVASKVEETPRRIKDFVNACAQKAQKNDALRLEEDSKDFMKWKDTMLHYEVILLETLCFDLAIEHPHTHLLELQSKFNVRKAWMLLFQSLGAPLCVLYHPKVVATAALLLATNLSSEELPENWWEDVDVDIGHAHELAADMLEYYTDHYIKKASSQSPHRSQLHHQTSSNGYLSI
ncbi:hypothetical protein DFQ28_011611 [Apophysomyces sp. BC1034]|nr:hypothetical protein DFQ28_011611 [Apophysomyces sp. BC1034]